MIKKVGNTRQTLNIRIAVFAFPAGNRLGGYAEIFGKALLGYTRFFTQKFNFFPYFYVHIPYPLAFCIYGFIVTYRLGKSIINR
jgi:hypothetical protein